MKIGEKPEQVAILPLEGSNNKIKNTKYGINKIENSFTSLSPKRRFLYQSCGVIMILVPLLFSVIGILICGFVFYQRKLQRPIDLLLKASKEIAEENLDFSISYESMDELGSLCESFEQMRKTLYENNSKMWRMLEDSRDLQASVAHDLRNPIAIIKGYVEYLKLNVSEDKLSKEKILSIANNVECAAERLEQYTESIQEIKQLQELTVAKTCISTKDVFTQISQDFSVMVTKNKLNLKLINTIEDQLVELDLEVLYRILENLIGNALRFAVNEIKIVCVLENHQLIISIEDDGPGFPKDILKSKGKIVTKSDSKNFHIGMGLKISTILCEKHGGNLNISNSDLGGCAKIFLKV
ncbi:MAG: HAMP domain-containing sensor histidine kinase [Clostridiales bacterium]|nr:HAMP domain-containing sensor histidine kinase [Clostridiales bacterium]